MGNQLSDAEMAFMEYVRNRYGWTRFAKLHTTESAKEYKRVFVAGYNAAKPPPLKVSRCSLDEATTFTAVDFTLAKRN